MQEHAFFACPVPFQNTNFRREGPSIDWCAYLVRLPVTLCRVKNPKMREIGAERDAATRYRL